MPLVQKTCEVSKRLSELRIILKSSVVVQKQRKVSLAT